MAIERRLTMLQKKSRIISVGFGIILLLLIMVMIFIYWSENRPIGVNELWQAEYEHRNLEGKTVTVRGDIVCYPLSDFRFNDLYLVDSETPEEYQTPSYGFWFGIKIDGISCMLYTNEGIVTCEPFNPCQATAFEFKGTIHLDQVGKKEIMWLSNVDFEQAHQLVNDKWQPVPLGKFTFPLERN